MEAHKKKELATYNKLGLERKHKYASRREATARGGIYLYIGGRRPDRPAVRVLRADYLRVRAEVVAELRKDVPGMSREAADDFARVRVEKEVYDRLLRQEKERQQLEKHFEKSHGRAMTPHEKELYGKVMKSRGGFSAKERAAASRKFWVDGVMKKVREAGEKQPLRLQEIWASVVGAEAAMETTLERVDALKKTAICRSVSSVVAFELRKQRDLPQKLGEALGVPLLKIVFR